MGVVASLPHCHRRASRSLHSPHCADQPSHFFPRPRRHGVLLGRCRGCRARPASTGRRCRIRASVDCADAILAIHPSVSLPQCYLPARASAEGRHRKTLPKILAPLARCTVPDLRRRRQTVDSTPRVTVSGAPADADPPSPWQRRSLLGPPVRLLRSTQATVTGGCHTASDGGCRPTLRSRGSNPSHRSRSSPSQLA